MKKIAILQSNYIPWKGYFDLLNTVDAFVIYDEVQYTKNDWRNRNRIKTANGLSWLTIPVNRNKLHQKINETEVSNDVWKVKHWKTIKNEYAKAKCFKEFEAHFYDLYQGIETKMLAEINLTFIKAVNEILGIKTEIINSVDLNLQGDKTERLVEAVKKLNGTHYVSGPSAKNYLVEENFTAEGVQVEWFNYENYKEYDQLNPPFEHAVSILDLIFNEGENAKNYFCR